jgi:hypothetical protein
MSGLALDVRLSMRSGGKSNKIDGRGGENTSMNWWCKEMESAFTSSMREEENRKPGRLSQALEDAGILPPEQYTFNFPKEERELFERCHRLERSGWKLTVRAVCAETGILLFRVLDSDVKSVEVGLLSLQRKKPISVTITPNKDPVISATLLARNGNAVMEMVYGPHHWVTKAPPPGIEIVRCWFGFPHFSVQYSTEDMEKRAMLFRHFTAVIRIGLGMRLREFADTQSSLYAEFQWHYESGYKFFDISWSWVWTGVTQRVGSDKEISSII